LLHLIRDDKLPPMIVFLACAAPIGFAMAYFVLSPRTDALIPGKSVARGLLIFVASYVVYLLISPAVEINFTSKGIYLFYLLTYELYFAAWSVISYLIFYKVPHTHNPAGETAWTLAYFTSFYIFLAVGDILLNANGLTAYLLFLLPISRIGIIYLTVGAFIFARRMYMIIRYILVLVPFAGAATAAAIPLLFIQSHAVAAGLLAGGIFLLGGCVFFFSGRK
jgi:hypothetical protein